MQFTEYRGMSYSQASKEATRLLALAARTGLWTGDLPERLIELRATMHQTDLRAA